MTHVFMFSFGRASFCAAYRWAKERSKEDMLLLFTDTMYEDEDTYAYGRAGARFLNVPLVEIADGRTPWQVFFDVRLIGNTRADPCSKILKRDLARAWMEDHYPDPATATVHVGIHAEEEHRMTAIRANWSPYAVEAPLTWRPVMGLEDMKRIEAEAGLWEQKLYAEGFPHANCGGRCVKQGQGGWIKLLERRPNAFREVERQEEEVRQHLGKDVSILRDRRGGSTKPLTLRTLREKVESGRKGECDLFDMGGCGCFLPPQEDVG